VKRIRRYFDEVWSELKKVSWPTREQVRNLTVLVFAISFVIGLYITVLDRVLVTALSFITPPTTST
jgi:preprotein translocase subunit SecE